jgi:transketolase
LWPGIPLLVTFGESAPAADLYRHFGITAERTVQRTLELLKR